MVVVVVAEGSLPSFFVRLEEMQYNCNVYNKGNCD